MKQTNNYCRQTRRRKNESHNYPDGPITLPRNIINVCNNSNSIFLPGMLKWQLFINLSITQSPLEYVSSFQIVNEMYFTVTTSVFHINIL